MENKLPSIQLLSRCFFVILIFSFQSSSLAQDIDNEDVAAPFVVSMSQLIVNPNFFHDQRVTVFGYFGHYNESALFLTKAHSIGSDTLSAVRLDILRPGPEQSKFPSCNGHYAYVTGRVLVEPFVAYSRVVLLDIESIKIADGPEGDKFQLCYEATP